MSEEKEAPRCCKAYVRAMASAAATTEAVYKQQLAEGRSEAYAQVTLPAGLHKTAFFSLAELRPSLTIHSPSSWHLSCAHFIRCL